MVNLQVFNQIDYILCRAAQKSILQNARSYAGTEANSHHRLVVTKMRIEKLYIYKKNKVKSDAPTDTDRLQKQEVRRKYSEQLREEFEEIKEEYINHQEMWNDAVR